MTIMLLELAHKRLAAYGWEVSLSDEEILERLSKLNLEKSIQDLTSFTEYQVDSDSVNHNRTG